MGSILKGFVIFKTVYRGVGAHAGAAPYAGKNALHAALLAQTGVAFLKDRFNPQDGVNVQPVLSEAAGTVNIVPDHAVVETYVRARTQEALFAAADLVGTCLRENLLSGASGDVGDLSALLPTVQFGFTGVSGRFHGDDFAIVDEANACLRPPKVLAGTVLDLFERPVSGREGFEARKAAYLKNWLGSSNA